jgi:cytochrome bd-type quinol oxidase subunit 2
MESRAKATLIVLGILLLPVLLMYPALALAHFGPCGPSNGWSLMIWALSAFAAGIGAIYLLRKTHQHGYKDWLSVARFPLWIAAGLFLAITGLILFFALPGFIYDIATHIWWFLLFLLATMAGGFVWLYSRATRDSEIPTLK